jgi:hypothetical protein
VSTRERPTLASTYIYWWCCSGRNWTLSGMFTTKCLGDRETLCVFWLIQYDIAASISSWQCDSNMSLSKAVMILNVYLICCWYMSGHWLLLHCIICVCWHSTYSTLTTNPIRNKTVQLANCNFSLCDRISWAFDRYSIKILSTGNENREREREKAMWLQFPASLGSVFTRRLSDIVTCLFLVYLTMQSVTRII